MSETVISLIVDRILERTKVYIEGFKGKKEWRTLFIETGAFIATQLDNDEFFERDLFAIFSAENMKQLSAKLQNKRGYDFPKILHDELFELMQRYDVDKQTAETYIHHFTQAIISYLERNNVDKSLEMFLSNWKSEEEKSFSAIEAQLNLVLDEVKKLSKSEITAFSISDIDRRIRREAKYSGMGLNFFELEDEQFAIKFKSAVKNDCVHITGKSREETLYRILNELNLHFSDRTVFVIQTEKEWNRLTAAGCEGLILIPSFYAAYIAAIPNNTNIFIYGEDEPCYHKEKIELHKRTRSNLVSALKAIGMDSSDAYKLVESTHGLYVPLKKRLFKAAFYNVPLWVEKVSDSVIAALLCGKWTLEEGDKLIIEELSGKRYDEFIKEMEQYAHGDNPFIIKYSRHGKQFYQLACVEDAWEELDRFIDAEKWKQFISLFYDVLIDSEPIFEYPFEKHFEASIYVNNSEWSHSLKEGMIRSLIMRAYYRGHKQNQQEVDRVISEVLNTITTKERWAYISQYIIDLCEASPSIVMGRLEQEINNPSGMIEVFIDNKGDFLTSKKYYTHILWAIEHLLQQRQYVMRAIDWVWKVDSYSIDYTMNNSPKTVLETVFCAWLSTCALSVNEKIDAARSALKNYKNAWQLIANELPSGTSATCMPLSLPRYREVTELQDLYTTDVFNTYVGYLKMCIDTAETDVEKWMVILEHLYNFDKEIQEEALNNLVSICAVVNDTGRIKIKNKIRSIINKHRYFRDATWSMDEEGIILYEALLNRIVTTDPIYEYIYLFTGPYDFPILHPFPYNEKEPDKTERTLNSQLMEKEIEERLSDFKSNSYSLEKLIKIVLQGNNNNLGRVLAQFYCHEQLDENVLKALVAEDTTGKHVYDYIRTIYYAKKLDLTEVLSFIKSATTNDELICDIISLQIIEEINKAHIFNESESIKKLFWTRLIRIPISPKASQETLVKAIDECFAYGSLETYIELLFELREELSCDQLYEFFVRCPQMKVYNPSSMSNFYIEQILKILQDKYIHSEEKCIAIAQIELYFRNLLEWPQMKCLQYSMKKDPQLYAELISIIYKKDLDESYNEEKAKLANQLYGLFRKAEFCPAETKGHVNYDELKAWLDRFKNLLEKQGQERLWNHLVGRLLAYSPLGEDGLMPCEAVRNIIEEYNNKDMISSYIIAEKNKRGVHTIDAGRSEQIISDNYRKNAEALQFHYPHTADIFYSLSESYKIEAAQEREIAENE